MPMEYLRITGGAPLSGTVEAAGSKNAALPIMAASILAGEPVRLCGVPRLRDVATLSRVLEELGVEVTPLCAGGLRLETIDPRPVRARGEVVRRMRASFCVLGPLLARRGRAMVSLPGGCNIGPRPVDRHLAGLAALGAELRIERGYVVARARRLVGTELSLTGPNGPTVTGTANVLCAAVLARGKTVIRGAAREPEIVDLGRFLNAIGARIAGLGTSTLRIDGVRELGGTTYRIIPDRIEAGTLLLAAAISRGSATVTGVAAEHLRAVLAGLRAAGIEVRAGRDWVAVEARERPRAISVTAQPYPGIPTDLQAQWMALLAIADGASTIEDRVFPTRLAHVAELNRLGARITLCGPTAVVRGVPRLSGARVLASDLRASAALVLAGLAAEGETRVDHAHHLDRGYQRLDEKLRGLGARIERCESYQPSAISRRLSAVSRRLSAIGSHQKADS
jgi:UDP-N-acetylglucosamine 1-carboxyvinyltransferase